MSRHSAKPAAKPLIAPEPTLPGTTGAVGMDVSKANFHACFLAHATARPQTGVFTAEVDAALQAQLPTIIQGGDLDAALQAINDQATQQMQ